MTRRDKDKFGKSSHKPSKKEVEDARYTVMFFEKLFNEGISPNFISELDEEFERVSKNSNNLRPNLKRIK
jgi:hypothetical protein